MNREEDSLEKSISNRPVHLHITSEDDKI